MPDSFLVIDDSKYLNQLIEVDAAPAAGRGRIRLHRHGHEADLEIPFPLRARGHDDPWMRTVTSLQSRSMVNV